jgi:nucleotide-binding universal stress UspA family protein
MQNGRLMANTTPLPIKNGMTGRITKILAAVDFSEASLNALETAASIAAKCEAVLYILYAHDNILEFIGINTAAARSVNNNSSDILAAICHDVTQKFHIRPIVIEYHLQANEAILKTIVTHDCDLVVMGTCGESGLRKGHIGTTAYSIIKYSVRPVLLIPPGRSFRQFKRPLYPIRPVASAFKHYQVLHQLLEKDSVLEVLGLYYPGEKDTLYDIRELMSRMKTKMELDKITANVSVCDITNIPGDILNKADTSRSDLIVIGPATDLTIKPFYVGPRSYYIIQNAKTPLLVIDKMARFNARAQLAD